MTTNSGTVVIKAPVSLAPVVSGDSISLTWPETTANALLEQSPSLGAGANWTVCTNAIVSGADILSVTVPNDGMNFYRLRRL